MVDRRAEADLGRGEGICGREGDVEQKCPAFIARRVSIAGMQAVYGEPCGPKMVAFHVMISVSSTGAALHRQ
jgi:hypothetical protein